MINRIICFPKFHINKIEHNNFVVNIFASVKSKGSQCPVCGSFSTSVHDTYTRKLSDLSAFQNSTTILLRTRKFKCKDSSCDRKVFSEQTPHTMRYSICSGVSILVYLLPYPILVMLLLNRPH